jgi:glycosyltransferase involved in cell wall biosynthesis
VSFVGPASDADKWALYESSELFVLPSYAENFGNVVIEAMAMGRAVVVSDAVGAAHIVAEAQAGRVNDGDSTSIARDINELHANPGMRQAMGERGRTYVVQHLGWPAIGARMEQQYARTIEMAGAAPRA